MIVTKSSFNMFLLLMKFVKFMYLTHFGRLLKLFLNIGLISLHHPVGGLERTNIPGFPKRRYPYEEE